MKLPAGYGFYFRRISDLLCRNTNRELANMNLTMSQMHLLMALRFAPRHMLPLKELESTFHNAQSTVAGLVSRLEKKGLVASCASPEDKRVKLVQLTDEGLDTCESSRTAWLKSEERIVSLVPESKREELLWHLQCIYRALNDEETDPQQPETRNNSYNTNS